MKQPSLLKNFARYVAPNVLAMVALSGYILADTFFVAQALGALGLAALNFGIAAFSVMQGFGVMLGIGGATRFSIQKSNLNPEGANKTFFTTLCFGGGVAVVFSIVGLFFARPLSALLGADAAALPLTATYLATTLGAAPFFIANNIVLAFVKNDDSPKLAMAATLTSSIANIVLDYVFVFPLQMGMFGAAFATALSPVISLCVLSLHFFKKKNSFVPVRTRIRPAKLFDIAALGSSALIAELASAIALIAFNLVIIRLAGNVGVAAYGIVANIALIAASIFTGVGQGVQPLASRSYGQRDAKALSRLLRYCVITCACLSALVYGIVFVFTQPLVSIFNSEQNLQLAAIAHEGARIYFIGYLFAGFNSVAAAYLSAIARVKSAMAISLLRSCVLLLPALFVLSSLLQMRGVWCSFIVTELCAAIVAIFALSRRKTG